MKDYDGFSLERVIPFRTYSGYEIAAIISLLPKWIADRHSPSTLLIGEWKPKTLFLPAYQTLEDVNLKKCREYNIDVVRISDVGGRAVLHTGNELYFMLSYRTEYWRDVTKHYKLISEKLVEAFRKLGIEASAHRRTFKKKDDNSIVEGWDIKIGGAMHYWSNKIAILGGKNLKNAVMRHGAIFFEPYTYSDFKLMLEIMNPPEDLDWDEAIKVMDRFCTPVRKYGEISKEDIYNAIKNAFSPEAEVLEFNNEETEKINELSEKYKSQNLEIERGNSLGLCILPWGWIPEWDIGEPEYPKKL